MAPQGHSASPPYVWLWPQIAGKRQGCRDRDAGIRPDFLGGEETFLFHLMWIHTLPLGIVVPEAQRQIV